jgi:hypothetical protein
VPEEKGDGIEICMAGLSALEEGGFLCLYFLRWYWCPAPSLEECTGARVLYSSTKKGRRIWDSFSFLSWTKYSDVFFSEEVFKAIEKRETNIE